jgi:outer membrane receptor protein involved in Fe transport
MEMGTRSEGMEFGLKTDFFNGRVSSTISYFEITRSILSRISRFLIKGLCVGGGLNYSSDKKLSIANPDLFFAAATLWAAWSTTFTQKNITDEMLLTGRLERA